MTNSPTNPCKPESSKTCCPMSATILNNRFLLYFVVALFPWSFVLVFYGYPTMFFNGFIQDGQVASLLIIVISALLIFASSWIACKLSRWVWFSVFLLVVWLLIGLPVSSAHFSGMARDALMSAGLELTKEAHRGEHLALLRTYLPWIVLFGTAWCFVVGKWVHARLNYPRSNSSCEHAQ